jgi:hypothetical protein
VLPLVSAVESPPFPFEPASADRVRITLADAVRRHAETLEALENAVAECVRCLRAQGMTPEATILTMKAFIRHTAVTSPPPGRATTWLPEPLMENIVRWCINEYFRHS